MAFWYAALVVATLVFLYLFNWSRSITPIGICGCDRRISFLRQKRRGPKAPPIDIRDKPEAQAGVNIGTGRPFSVGLKTTFTFCPMATLSRSVSTMLVIIVTPSSRRTYAMQ